MICSPRRVGWDVTFQRAHAAMAAQILTRWRPDTRPSFWPHLLAACAQHDNGWTEWEPAGRLSEVGAPIDFKHVDLEVILKQAERVVALGWHQDSVVGWLISRHMHHLYLPRRHELKELDTWLERETRRRERRRERAELSEGELERAYTMMLWCDTLSLTLCEAMLPFAGRAIEIEPLPSGVRTQMWWEDETSREVGVWPWPLDGVELEVHVEHYQLDDLTYPDHEAFLTRITQTLPSRRAWRLKRAPRPRLDASPLIQMTRDELVELAKTHGLSGYSALSKDQLLCSIATHSERIEL